MEPRKAVVLVRISCTVIAKADHERTYAFRMHVSSELQGDTWEILGANRACMLTSSLRGGIALIDHAQVYVAPCGVFVTAHSDHRPS